MFINLFCFTAENVHRGLCLLWEFSFKMCCFTHTHKKCCFITSRDMKLTSLDVKVLVATASVHRHKAVGKRLLTRLGELAVPRLTPLVPTWHRSPPHSPPAVPLPPPSTPTHPVLSGCLLCAWGFRGEQSAQALPLCCLQPSPVDVLGVPPTASPLPLPTALPSQARSLSLPWPQPSQSQWAEEFSRGPVPTLAFPLQLGSHPCWGSLTPGLKKRPPHPTQLSRGDPSASQALSPHIPPSETSVYSVLLPRNLLPSMLFASRRHLQALLWANWCLRLSPCLWRAP